MARQTTAAEPYSNSSLSRERSSTSHSPRSNAEMVAQRSSRGMVKRLLPPLFAALIVLLASSYPEQMPMGKTRCSLLYERLSSVMDITHLGEPPLIPTLPLIHRPRPHIPRLWRCYKAAQCFCEQCTARSAKSSCPSPGSTS